jgi:hypothetical protein
MKTNDIVHINSGEFTGLYGKLRSVIKFGQESRVQVRVYRGPKYFDVWADPVRMHTVPQAVGICTMGKPQYVAG